ncbi:MAG: UbiA family prenyltransferase [Deltaproteobacteria bacterium]|nr:UbiA family prenyltransferase [Candidatus Deferrimicrobium borealis]
METLPCIAINVDSDAGIPEPGREIPLCVDLDGTLAKTDVLLETIVNAIKTHWIHLFLIPAWFFSGKAAAKRRLATVAPIDPSTIPYNDNLIEYLRREHERGRKIVLATASDRKIAEPIARHLGFFDDVVASDGITNLKGEAKANALADLYGERGFSYAGNSRSDLPVWRRAKSALPVNTSRSVSRTVAALLPIERKFRDRKPILRAFIREIRPHQWVKNILIFIPPLIGHILSDAAVLFRTIVTFEAFCLAASGIYLMNDLLDLETDRNHPRKRNRPFASGDLPLQFGLAGPILIASAVAIGSAVSSGIMITVSLYIFLSLAYSKYLKTQPLVDVFCLAALYTIRVFAGGVGSGSGVSIWLLNFSGFLFLSLGFLKRYAEYSSDNPSRDSSVNHRRGYTRTDSILLMMMGLGSSFISSVILGFYVDSMQAHIAYRNPLFLWGIVPVILFWQCRMWLSTVRGYMLDDPIVYAAKDRISQYVTAIVVLIYLLASIEAIPLLEGLLPGQIRS